MNRRTDRFEWERKLRQASIPWYLKSFCLLVGTYINREVGAAWPSAATLQKNTGLSRQRVFELLKEAEQAGWFELVKIPGDTTRRIPTVPKGSEAPDPSDVSDPPTRQAGLTGESETSDGGSQAGLTQRSKEQEVFNKEDLSHASAGNVTSGGTDVAPRERDDSTKQEPAKTSTPTLAGLVQAATDATEDEAHAVITRLRPNAKTSLTGYVRSIIAAGDMQAHVDDLRPELTTTQERPGQAGIPTWCGQCGDGYGDLASRVSDLRKITLPGGDLDRCPDCHPSSVPARALSRRPPPRETPGAQESHDDNPWAELDTAQAPGWVVNTADPHSPGYTYYVKGEER